MCREAHEAAPESCVKTGWGAPESPEKLSQVKSNYSLSFVYTTLVLQSVSTVYMSAQLFVYI